MKGWKKKCLQGCNGLLGSLLAVMGFSACEHDLMYGAPMPDDSPYADFMIKGTVTNEADEPLPDIQIRSPWRVTYYDKIYTLKEDTVYTDANGEFTYAFQLGDSTRDRDVPLLIEDIDGEANGGSYASDSVSVSFDGVELTGGKGWYMGKAEKEVNIRLKEKQDNE